MTYSLEINNLTKNYPHSNFYLEDVSFTVPKGTIMGFVGENGAGKTTTMNAILNIVKKDSGIVKILGQEMDDKDTDLREDIGVVFDTVNFPGTLTPTRLEKVMAGVYKKWNQELYYNTLTKFNIPLDKKIKQFSRGMTMQLSIAIALSHTPKLLILDEATAGLDPVIRDEILDVFLGFVEDENNSILMSSHITSDLEKIADYITLIHKGRIILTEKKDNLIYNYGVARCSTEQFEHIASDDRISYRKKDYQIDVLVKDKAAFMQRYPGIIVDNVVIDDIMLLLIKGEK
jgi:ABC-2 type transport system ATP-binding protein